MFPLHTLAWVPAMVAVIPHFTTLDFPRTLEGWRAVGLLLTVVRGLAMEHGWALTGILFSWEAAIQKGEERVSAHQPFPGF